MDDLVIQMADVLDGYEKELDDIVNVTMREVAKETAKKLKETSPKSAGGGEYADGWTVKNEAADKTYIVYNKDKPSLTHLLENGHLIRNQYGTWTRKGGGNTVEGRKHIKPAEEWANAEVIARITKRLENV